MERNISTRFYARLQVKPCGLWLNSDSISAIQIEIDLGDDVSGSPWRAVPCSGPTHGAGPWGRVAEGVAGSLNDKSLKSLARTPPKLPQDWQRPILLLELQACRLTGIFLQPLSVFCLEMALLNIQQPLAL